MAPSLAQRHPFNVAICLSVTSLLVEAAPNDTTGGGIGVGGVVGVGGHLPPAAGHTMYSL
jgi:hypothetical protein